MSTLKVNKLEKVSGNSKFILQSQRFQAPETSTTITQYGSASNTDIDGTPPTTSNTQSVWTAVFTPVSSTSIIIGQYTCQEDAQGTNGFLIHTVFLGSTFLSGSCRYVRESNSEPYTQSFSFTHDHNSSSAITYDFRYAATAGIHLKLNRFDQEGGTSQLLTGNCGILLWEIEQ